MSLKTLRSAALLSLGAALGQAIGLAALPLLARFYSPESFGAFGTYLAIVAIGGLIATLKLDVGLIKADSEQEATALFWGGALVATLLGAACAGVLLIWAAIGEVPQWAFAVAPSIPLFALLQLAYGYCNRQQKYGSMAFRKGANAVLAVSFQLAIAWLLHAPSGLVVGYLLSLTLVTAIILREIRDWVRFPPPDLSVIRSAVSKHRTFTTQLLPASLANVVSFQMPVIFMTWHFGMQAGGYYTFAAIILGAPIALVASAVGEVLRQRIASDVRENRRLGKDVWVSLSFLAACGGLVFGGVYGLGDQLIVLLGGQQWAGAGEVVKVIAPLLAVQFVGNPMGYILSVLDGHSAYLRLQVAQASLLVLVGFASVSLRSGFITTVALVVIVQILIYVLTAIVGLRMMRFGRVHAS